LAASSPCRQRDLVADVFAAGHACDPRGRDRAPGRGHHRVTGPLASEGSASRPPLRPIPRTPRRVPPASGLIEERKQPRVAALPLKEPRRFRPELALAAQRLASKHPPRSVAAEGGLALCHACDRRATPTPSRAEWPAGQAGDRRISAYLSLGAAFLTATPYAPNQDSSISPTCLLRARPQPSLPLGR